MKLAALRAQRGLSQRALAELSKVTNVTIARIESGVYDPRLSTLRQLAKALKEDEQGKLKAAAAEIAEEEDRPVAAAPQIKSAPAPKAKEVSLEDDDEDEDDQEDEEFD